MILRTEAPRKTRPTVLRVAASVIALGLLVTGCSGRHSGGSDSIGSTNDIAATDVSQVRDGGNLRLATTSMPATFNPLHLDTDADAAEIPMWALPSAFDSDPAGRLTVDHNYFTSVELTGTNPQKITYTINPKAVWSDGTPITWEDLASQVNALSGHDPAYQALSTVGYDRIAKVDRGVDDRQAVITFARNFSEWQGLFSGLLPKAATATPEAFNDFYRNGMPISGGPFQINTIDRAQNRIVLGRNPRWWGDRPKLDTVTYSVLDWSARIAAIQNNEVDSAEISSIDEVTSARSTPNVQVLRSPSPKYSTVAFNGAPGSILADPALRRAVAQGINRQAIVSAIQLGIVDDPKPLNNHVFMRGQEGYQDNSAPIAFNPDQANRELDALGWVRHGDVREKDGRQLVIRDVMYQQDNWTRMAQIMQQNLAAIGVKLDIQTYPGKGFFTDVVNPGNFDLAQFSWVGSAQPLSGLPQMFSLDPNNKMSNPGRIGSPQLNALIDQALSELDPKKAIDLANQADRQIFEEVHSLPVTQSAGTFAQRTEVANWGAFGLATPDYTKVGFRR